MEKHQRRRNPRRTLAAVAVCLLLAASVCLCVWLGLLVSEKLGASRPAENPVSGVPTEPTAVTTTTEPTEPPTELDVQDLELRSPVVMLYDLEADTVLLAREATQVREPASLTKMLVAATALHLCDGDTWMTVGDEIDLIDPEASRAYLQKGHIYKLKDLTAALLLPSGADAAYCIAVNVGRAFLGPEATAEQAIEYFMGEVNRFAAFLGAANTHYVTPDGISDPAHLTTAEDQLIILRYCLTEGGLAPVLGAARYSAYTQDWYGVTFQNTNLLLRSDSEYYYADAIAGKTGFTDEAGYCLAAAAQRDGRTLLVILMGSGEPNGRFVDAKALFERAFAQG